MTGHRYTEVTIFVGKDHKSFCLKKTDVDKIEYLKGLVQFDDELRSHVKLYDEQDMPANDFMPVVSYLQSGDFEPRFLDRESPQLEDVFMTEQHAMAVSKIGGVYLTAMKLRFANLQDLCVRKLKILQSLSAEALLIAVTYNAWAEAEGNEDGEFRAWLVDHLAEQFFKLYERNSVTMVRIMAEHDELREDVIDRLPAHRDTRNRDM